MTTHIKRRRALTVVAAVPAIAVLPALPGAGGELTALVRRYFAEVDVFNTSPDLGDDDYFHADQPFDTTLREMIGDADAAVQVVLPEGEACMIDFRSEAACDKAAASCLHALRYYLAVA